MKVNLFIAIAIFCSVSCNTSTICNISNCFTCISELKCSECKSGYHLNDNNECIKTTELSLGELISAIVGSVLGSFLIATVIIVIVYSQIKKGKGKEALPSIDANSNNDKIMKNTQSQNSNSDKVTENRSSGNKILNNQDKVIGMGKGNDYQSLNDIDNNNSPEVLKINSFEKVNNSISLKNKITENNPNNNYSLSHIVIPSHLKM